MSDWNNGWQSPAPTPIPTAEQLFAQAEMRDYVKAPLTTVERDIILLHHDGLKKALEAAKENELAFRKFTVKAVLPDAKEGMNNVDLGNGYTLKAGVKYNYKLKGTNEEIEKALDDIEAMGNEGKFLAERLVSWTPNFLLTEYRMLNEKDATDIQKKILARINEVLEITDAAPSLEIKEPKSKK